MSAANSFIWSSIEKVGQNLVQLLILIVLTRLLSVEAFGLISILNIFILLANTIIDAGFSQALIRKQNCSTLDYSSVFWFNFLVGIILYICLFFSAPLISDFFDDQNLTAMSRILFLIIPIGSLNVIQITKINKELNFRLIALYTVLAAILSGGIGIVLAYLNYGVWSLVIQSVLNVILMTLFFLYKSNWKPACTFSIASIRELIPFSINLFVTNFFNTLFNNMYVFVIAKFFSPIQLGYYAQANKFASQPSNLIDAILSRMSYPILSMYQDDKCSYKKYFRNMQTTIVAFVFPLMILLLSISKEFIVLVLGDKWMPILPYFQLICIAGLTFPIHSLCMSTLKVFGNSLLILKLEIMKKILIILLIAISIQWGLFALVLGQTLYFWIVFFINAYYSGREISYSIKEQILDLGPYFILSISFFIISYMLNGFFSNVYLSILLKFISLLVVYSLGFLLFDLNEIKNVVGKLFNKKE